MRATDLVLVLGVVAALAVAGCSSDVGASASSRCSPGLTHAHVCPGGTAGGQECASYGSRWLSCDGDGVGDIGLGGGSMEGFVLVSAGTFTMGSSKGEVGRFDSECQHEVTLTRSFYLQSTEVTQGQWTALMKFNPSKFQSCGVDCPVDDVTWWEAVAYANALSVHEGLPECYTLKGCSKVSPGKGMNCGTVSVNASGGDPYRCVGYRLPTESEWEYAYRAGTTTAYYDANVDAIGWFKTNSGGTPHPVGTKTSNAWDLYDMAGNAAEWCWDWYGAYPLNKITNPRGPGSGSYRVLRAGSWDDGADDARAARRLNNLPGNPLSILGFRLAKSAP